MANPEATQRPFVSNTAYAVDWQIPYLSGGKGSDFAPVLPQSVTPSAGHSGAASRRRPFFVTSVEARPVVGGWGSGEYRTTQRWLATAMLTAGFMACAVIFLSALTVYTLDLLDAAQAHVERLQQGRITEQLQRRVE